MVSSIDSIKYNLTLLNKRNEKVTYQMSSGDALQNGSDNAQQYNKILSINNNVSTYTSILERIQTSSSYNTNSDSSVANMKTSMESIMSLLQKALTDTTTSDTIESIANEIETEKDTIFSLANTKIDGQYLFSGKSSTVQPFVKDVTTGKITYVATDDNKTVNVENNNYATQGLNGKELLYYTDETTSTQVSVFDNLDEIINALELQDSDGNTITQDEADTILSDALDKLNSAYDSMNIAHSKLGTRTASIENYESIVQTKLTNFTILQEEYASADLTSLAIESQALENTYTALYSTINKVNSLSLVQYLN
jgi:flagellar hook-associated protein 3 FlgL